jgi:hypothetical protein
MASISNTVTKQVSRIEAIIGSANDPGLRDKMHWLKHSGRICDARIEGFATLAAAGHACTSPAISTAGTLIVAGPQSATLLARASRLSASFILS